MAGRPRSCCTEKNAARGKICLILTVSGSRFMSKRTLLNKSQLPGYWSAFDQIATHGKPSIGQVLLQVGRLGLVWQIANVDSLAHGRVLLEVCHCQFRIVFSTVLTTKK